jgi:hypothetical protein
MVGPVVPNQFEVGKNKIVHKPTKAAFKLPGARAAAHNLLACGPH